MPRDCNGEQSHQQLRPPPLIHHRNDAIADSEPHHRHRNNLHTQWYGTMFAKVADILAKNSMVEQPFIERRRSFKPRGSREKQEGRSGQHRQEYAENA